MRQPVASSPSVNQISGRWQSGHSPCECAVVPDRAPPCAPPGGGTDAPQLGQASFTGRAYRPTRTPRQRARQWSLGEPFRARSPSPRAQDTAPTADRLLDAEIRGCAGFPAPEPCPTGERLPGEAGCLGLRWWGIGRPRMTQLHPPPATAEALPCSGLALEYMRLKRKRASEHSDGGSASPRAQ